MPTSDKEELIKSLLFDEYQAKDDLSVHVVKLDGWLDRLHRLADGVRALISYASSSGASGVPREQAIGYQNVCVGMEIRDLKNLADETLNLQDRIAEIQSRKKRLRLGDQP